MGVRVLWDGDADAAVLYDSVTETAFGRVFHGDAQEKAEAFLKWYATNGPERDPRVDPNIGDVQDAWLASLDDGCQVCHAASWEPCDADADPHERTFTRCGRHEHGCRRPARAVDAKGGMWCSSHAPRGSKTVAW